MSGRETCFFHKDMKLQQISNGKTFLHVTCNCNKCCVVLQRLLCQWLRPHLNVMPTAAMYTWTSACHWWSRMLCQPGTVHKNAAPWSKVTVAAESGSWWRPLLLCLGSFAAIEPPTLGCQCCMHLASNLHQMILPACAVIVCHGLLTWGNTNNS